jgi:hypothetical protein
VNSCLVAQNLSTVNMLYGDVSELYACGSSTVNLSGGNIKYELDATDFSTVKFFGQNFLLGPGLFLDGSQLLGTGSLSGAWMNGTPWTVNISEHDSTARILLIPEPCTLLFLGLGAAMVRLRSPQVAARKQT